MHQSNVETEKAKLRESLISQRSEFQQTAEVKAGLELQIGSLCKQLKVRCVAGYLPYGTEPDIEKALLMLLEKGVRIVMPISNSDNTLSWVVWHGEHRLPGIFKFEEALGELTDLKQVDLILVPALGATSTGIRIGKGKGYYDRALEHFSGTTAAVVFDHELLQEIPNTSHDRAVDFVITQSRTLLAG